MSNRDHRRDDGDFIEPVASGRAKEIPWTHPTLARLSEAARLIYACLVDGRSETACATLREVNKRYPNASKAVKTKVSSEQSRLSC